MEETTDTSDYLLAFPYDFVPGGAIFDCDGTLADTMPLHYKAWREIMDLYECPFPETLFYEWGGVTTPEIVERLNLLYNKEMDPHQITHEKEEAYTRLIPQAEPIDAVIAEVHRLHGKCPISVASGGMRIVVSKTVAAVGLTELFPVMVTADDVSRGKPDPETFLLAAEKMGVAPEACVVYEDSPAGLLAAERAGMKAVDVRPLYTRMTVTIDEPKQPETE